MALNSYTVIGYYEDNLQPFMAHVKAETPQAAARLACTEEHTDCPEELLIVEVVAGEHLGLLGNDKVFSPLEITKDEPM